MIGKKVENHRKSSDVIYGRSLRCIFIFEQTLSFLSDWCCFIFALIARVFCRNSFCLIQSFSSNSLIITVWVIEFVQRSLKSRYLVKELRESRSLILLTSGHYLSTMLSFFELCKGQMKSEYIYEIIENHRKNLIDFCPEILFRLGMLCIQLSRLVLRIIKTNPMYLVYKTFNGKNLANFLGGILENRWFHKYVLTLSNLNWVLKMQWKNVKIRSRHKKITCLRQFKILSGNHLTYDDASQNQLVMGKTSKELTVDILQLEGKYSM